MRTIPSFVASWLLLLCTLLPGLVRAEPVSTQPRVSAFFTSDGQPDWTREGQPVTLELRVEWEGPQDRFILYPPTLELSSTLSKGPLTQFFESSGGKTTYHFLYQLTASTAGTVETGKASIQYRDQHAPLTAVQPGSSGIGAAATGTSATGTAATGTAATGTSTGSGGPTFTPPPSAAVNDTIALDLPTLEVRPGGMRGSLGQVLGVGAGFLVLVLLFRQLRRRSTQRSQAPETLAPEPTLEALLEQARAALTNGNHLETYALLLKLKGKLPPSEDPLPSQEQLEDALLQLKYGGRTALPEGLERHIQAVERVIKASRHKN